MQEGNSLWCRYQPLELAQFFMILQEEMRLNTVVKKDSDLAQEVERMFEILCNEGIFLCNVRDCIPALNYTFYPFYHRKRRIQYSPC